MLIKTKKTKMKNLNLFIAICLISILFSCQKEQALQPDVATKSSTNAREAALTGFTSTPYASGLITPIGMAIDEKGRIWVSEKGLGNNDGQISVILQNGQKKVVYTGFESDIDPFEGQPEGLTHLAIRDEKLYFLHGVDGKLFIVNIENYKPSNPPIASSSLPFEDLKTYIKSQNLTPDNNSDAYNLCFGGSGDLFIVDAGANAIIKRDKRTKSLSVFAKIPGHPVPPNPFGVPFTDGVPTGIVWDGNKFIVSTLGGFPFSEGLSPIFQITASGAVSVYATNFTALTDICLTENKKPLVLQYSNFVFAPPLVGFQPNLGRILDKSGNVLLDNLNFPTSLIRGEDEKYFVLSTGSGTISRLKRKGED